jgi:hypothetical protein
MADANTGTNKYPPVIDGALIRQQLPPMPAAVGENGCATLLPASQRVAGFLCGGASTTRRMMPFINL